MYKVFLGLTIAVLAGCVDGFGQCAVRVTTLVDGVEARLAGLRDMSADFVQFQEDGLNRTYREEGHLYLRRPRDMRWEYRSPEEKLFIVRGDTMYSYVPADRQVRRDSVEESFDDRVPILFLLGRSDLGDEFTNIVTLNEVEVAGTCGIEMVPRRESEIERVLLEVDPGTFDIRRLRLTSLDGSVSEFAFGDIETNRGLSGDLFEFVPPAGVRVIEGFE